MPVKFDSSSSGQLLVAGGAASGNITKPHQVSTLARDRVLAATWMLWTGEADTTGATFAATFGGAAMTEHDSVRFNSDKCYFGVFVREDALRGERSAVASFSGMPSEGLVTRNFMAITETYSGYEELQDAVSAVGGSTTVNSVTVPSVRPAHRVVSGHAVGKLRAFTKDGYNRTKRQSVTMLGGGALLSGDAPGAETVACTATHVAASANWGAIGFALTPSVVEIGVKLRVPLKRLRAAIAMFRTTTPHPDREYPVPPVAIPNDRVQISNMIVSADGVKMPRWVKDVDDTLDYTLYWHNHIAPDDEIVHVEHIPSGALRVASESFDASKHMTQVWIAGGAPQQQHAVRVRFTTRRGRRHDRTFYIVGVNN